MNTIKRILSGSVVPSLTLVLAVAMAQTPALAKDAYFKAQQFDKSVSTSSGLSNVPMWGYADCHDDATFTTCDAPTSPGPTVRVPAGESLTIHVQNELPALSNVTNGTSVLIPGLPKSLSPVRWPVTGNPALDNRIYSFDAITASPGVGTYTWTNPSPGTYLYHSGTHPQVQVQMGLYGAVVVEAGTDLAYSDVPYTQDSVVLFSEIDPALHEAVALDNYANAACDPLISFCPSSTEAYTPRFFLINGESFPSPSLDPLLTAAANDDILLRLVNAGIENHAPQLLGGYFEVIAEDGHRAPTSRNQHTILLPAGKSQDVLFHPTADAIYALFDRRLRTINDTGPGGMFARIQVGDIPTPPTASLYFSTFGNTSVPGIAGGPFDNADIYFWDGALFSRVFDASAVGLPANADIDAMQVVDSDTIYMSFSANITTVPTLGGIDDSDVVLYDAGTWSVFFDGSDVSLTTFGEDIDAFDILADGSIVISTLGAPAVGVAGQNHEDLLRCVGTFGATTSCSWSMYFDALDIGLGGSAPDGASENVDGASVATGNIYLTTVGIFNNGAGFTGDGSDVFACVAPTTGTDTACGSLGLYFDGSANGITDSLDAITVGAVAPPPNAPPIAVDDAPTVFVGGGATLINVLSNDTDPNGNGTLNPASVTVVTAATKGTLSAPNPATGAIAYTYTGTGPFPDSDSFTYTVADSRGAASNQATVFVTIEEVVFPTSSLYFSTLGNTAVPGVAGPYDNADVYYWDGAVFGRVFDGSVLGLPGGANIDALSVVDADTLYLSFTAPIDPPGPLGTVDDSDIVLYDAGTWSLYFDGSDVGLTTDAQDVDAFNILPDGSIVISTLGTAGLGVAGTSGDNQEDLLRCVGTFGPATTCSWTMYYDGLDVGFGGGTSAENTDGTSVSAGYIFITTSGTFNNGLGFTGQGADVFACIAPTTGANTACGGFGLYFDASANGITDNLDAIDVPAP